MSRQPKPKPPHKLHLTTNSLRNTTMSVEDDSFYYEIVTRFWHPNVTKIYKTDMETREVSTVVEIERISSREPRVRFGGDKGEWVSAADFVQYDQDHAYVRPHSDVVHHSFYCNTEVERSLAGRISHIGGKHTTEDSRCVIDAHFNVILPHQVSNDYDNS